MYYDREKRPNDLRLSEVHSMVRMSMRKSDWPGKAGSEDNDEREKIRRLNAHSAAVMAEMVVTQVKEHRTALGY